MQEVLEKVRCHITHFGVLFIYYNFRDRGEGCKWKWLNPLRAYFLTLENKGWGLRTCAIKYVLSYEYVLRIRECIYSLHHLGVNN